MKLKNIVIVVKDIEKSKLPNEVKEGSIVKCINGKYIYDEELTKQEQEIIKQEMNDLWE